MSQHSMSMRDCKGVRKDILYKALNSTQLLQENVNSNTPIELDNVMHTMEIVNQQLSLDEKVENQDEVVLDSEVMRSSSSVIRQCTNSLRKDFNTYNVNEYAEFFIDYAQYQMNELSSEGEAIMWSAIEFEILPLFKKTAYFSNLSGALDPLPKRQIQRKLTQQKRAPLAQVKRPEKQRTINENETEEASMIVQKIRKLIAQHFNTNKSSLDYFQLILNPIDYGKTVENILHVAFLVRDGYIQLFRDEMSGSLQVILASKELLTQAKSSGKKKSVQNILSLTHDQWQILLNFYKLQEPMIAF